MFLNDESRYKVYLFLKIVNWTLALNKLKILDNQGMWVTYDYTAALWDLIRSHNVEQVKD